MLAAFGAVLPELLNKYGGVQFSEPVWWRVGYAKLQVVSSTSSPSWTYSSSYPGRQFCHCQACRYWSSSYMCLSQGDTLDYLGVPGLHIAGAQGVLVIAFCQVILMVCLTTLPELFLLRIPKCHEFLFSFAWRHALCMCLVSYCSWSSSLYYSIHLLVSSEGFLILNNVTCL